MAHKGKFSKEKTKQEIHEKVREIRLRQQNWMKQREDHLASASSSASSLDYQSHSHGKEKNGKKQAVASSQPAAKSPPSYARPTQLSHRRKVEDRDEQHRKQQPAIPAAKNTHRQRAPLTSDTKNRFQHWRNARKEANETPNSDLVLESARTEDLQKKINVRTMSHSAASYRTESDDVSLSRYGVVLSTGQSEFSSHDEDSVGQSDEGYQYEKEDLSSRTLKWDESGGATQRKQLSPEEFDTLADQIIKRVKEDLRTSTSEKINSARKEKAKIGKNIQDGQIINKVKKDTSGCSDNRLEGHKCVICKKPMVQASHSPMLFIPCGHTVCKMCAEPQKFCTFCGTAITSKTCNIALQKVITDFYFKEPTNNSGVGDVSDYRPSQYTYQSEKECAVYSDKKNRVNYDAELKSLLVRQEVLEATTQDIATNLTQLKKKKEKQQSQIDRISQEEQRIRKELEMLKEKLQALSMHKREYQQRVEELDKEQFDEKNKLALTEETLRSLKGQIDKVCIQGAGLKGLQDKFKI
ncbi:uncharacterized protein LOC106156838 [Lingula anatina]|uniref:Uncharacterized protein LOC106156838 n=1 Tax=Lingula anatina TaxID=7574 RepID=A0A1S3HNU6_LINAN|nr:uncharacterized protein LOC106156838 [Lingula anatina]|eukprot:XP_013387722.1 uncharacterized protein LOC106156838 [Lingula anatina]